MNLMEKQQANLGVRHRIKLPPVVWMLLLFLIAFTVLFPDRFLTPMSISAMLGEFVTIILFALGPTIVAVVGSMDMTYLGIWMLGGILWWYLTPILGPAAVLVVPALGLATGWLVGTLLVRARAPSFILTMCLTALYAGLTARLAGGYPRMIRGFDFLTARVMPVVPTELLWSLPLIVIAVVLMRWTPLGVRLRAVGSNQMGARLAGLNADRYRVIAFTLSGLLSGLGAIVQVKHLGGAVPLALDMEMLVAPLVAIVLGGTLFTGGAGGPERTILGTLAYVVLYRGLYTSFLRPETLEVLVGLVLVGSVIFASRGLKGVKVT